MLEILCLITNANNDKKIKEIYKEHVVVLLHHQYLITLDLKRLKSIYISHLLIQIKEKKF